MTLKFDSPYFLHYVKDMERAITFYKQAFQVNTTAVSPGWSQLDFDTFELCLHILHDTMDEEVLPNAGLNLRVTNLEEAADPIVEAGGKLLGIQEATPHVRVRVARFADTEGNQFELRQEV